MTQSRINWKTLVSKAREESVPSLDVAGLVAQRIARSSTIPMLDWPTWSATGMSVAAALLMMFTTTLTGVSWDDPFGDWFSSLFLVMS